MGCEDPLVLLTGIGNREVDVQAMTIGAVDFLVKSEINTEKLERCIRYALERSSYIKALRINERKFRSMFERSKDSVFLTGEDLVFRDVNSATCELFKYGKEDILRLSLYNLFARKEAAEQLKEKLAMIGEVEDLEVELLTRNKGGRIASCPFPGRLIPIRRELYPGDHPRYHQSQTDRAGYFPD
jgi:PAS domain S-box-containing protein